MKLRRLRDSHYETYDGEWTIWKEPYDTRRWYVNREGYDETEVTDGFRSKREAVEWLEKRLQE